MAEYKVQINVKVGDHLININGESPQEAVGHLQELAAHVAEIHEAMSILDGRPATEIVQKEKQWGARSQGGRSYNRQPAQAQAAPQQVSQPQQNYPAAQSGWGPQTTTYPQQQPQQDAHQLIQQQLGGQMISQTPNNDPFPPCPIHGQPLRYFPAGTNQAGKPYSARWSCTERGCSTAHWQQRDGSWS